MNTSYRYPGARPFSADQAGIFFGRKQDIESLTQTFGLEQTVLLHSKSGIGKSSLINAGLIPAIKKQNQFIPFLIRFGAYMREHEDFPSPLESTLPFFEDHSGVLDRIRPEKDQSLWYHIKARQLNTNDKRGILIIFDQFEELFTYPRQAIEDFAKQISELLFTNIPDRYRSLIEIQLTDGEITLTPQDLSLIHKPINVKVLMAIRSDRLSYINEIKNYLPGIFDNLYELKPLDIKQAEDAILLPAYDQGSFESPIFDFEDEAVEDLLHFLSHEEKEEIESFQLQIICEYIEQYLVLKHHKPLITQKDLENLSEILENFYFNKINEIEPLSDRIAARKLIEEGFILEEEKRRLSIYEGQIRKSYGIGPELLSKLLATHLIRSEPSVRGGFAYELSHDTLVEPVLKAKNNRIAIENKKIEEAEKRAQEEELQVERQRAKAERELRKAAETNSRKAKRNSRVALFVACCAIFIAIFAYRQYRNATDNKLKAELALQRFHKEEADNVKATVQDLVKRSKGLPQRHNKDRKVMLDDASALLIKYPNNPLILSYRDSIQDTIQLYLNEILSIPEQSTP